MVGIYKVTNPIGQVYIGQSKDVDQRIKKHKGIISSHKQYLLKESYLKYGFENHKFELINECYEENLLEFERYWQDKYEAIGPNGLNMELTKTDDKPRVYRNDHPLKNKMWAAGAKLTAEKVLAIRRLYKINPKFKRSVVARKLGVSSSAILSIIQNKTWTDLKPGERILDKDKKCSVCQMFPVSVGTRCESCDAFLKHSAKNDKRRFFNNK
jgi:hypothetical protein